jgi:hypothetical protein
MSKKNLHPQIVQMDADKELKNICVNLCQLRIKKEQNETS